MSGLKATTTDTFSRKTCGSHKLLVVFALLTDVISAIITW